MPLSLLDFDILRFKLSKLLKLKEKRITDIYFYDDNSVGVQTFPFGLVKFDSLQVIEDDYKMYYPTTELPNRLKLVCDANDDCKPSVINTKD